jgi:hypothetical protein
MLPDAIETQPDELVTVKVYVAPAGSPVTVLVVPVPVVVVPPGDLVSVQVPVDGRPLNATLPVVIEQVGCVILPTTGAVGVAGCAFITMFADTTEIQPAAFVTVKE